MSGVTESLMQVLRRVWRAWLSDAACAECGKSERPWRLMMWYPFNGTSGGAFICSDQCWEGFDAR